jgi:hypothetical protein
MPRNFATSCPGPRVHRPSHTTRSRPVLGSRATTQPSCAAQLRRQPIRIVIDARSERPACSQFSSAFVASPRRGQVTGHPGYCSRHPHGTTRSDGATLDVRRQNARRRSPSSVTSVRSVARSGRKRSSAASLDPSPGHPPLVSVDEHAAPSDLVHPAIDRTTGSLLVAEEHVVVWAGTAPAPASGIGRRPARRRQLARVRPGTQPRSQPFGISRVPNQPLSSLRPAAMGTEHQ